MIDCDSLSRDRKPAERWPVMVLAHNEESHIESCIDSIINADAPLEIFVMANGCTDRTEMIVRDFGRHNPNVHLISIDLGDKCNAWNVFIHEIVPGLCANRSIYFFMTGDAIAVPTSFAAMARTLQEDVRANAVSAPPASGRNMARDRDQLLRQRGLVANLYGLRGSFVKRCIATGVRIPLKLEGDDGLIGALARWDLNPQQPMDSNLIAPCEAAGFVFRSFRLFRFADWMAYWRRMVRYGRSRYEFSLLGPKLRAGGLGAMPRDIRDIYDGAGRLRLNWDGVYTIPNWVALREMRRAWQAWMAADKAPSSRTRVRVHGG